MRNIYQPACGVIPSHMLRHAAAHGDAGHRQLLEATLARMEVLQEGRCSPRALLPPQRPARAPLRKRRNVYDAGHRQSLPGKLVASEQKGLSSTADDETKEAYEGAGVTIQFYGDALGRNSIDDRGMRVDSSVHYGKRFANAMWNGRQIIYGDGDGKLFNRFTSSLDVIGHELSHGVTQYTAGLSYVGQTGALNEHYSDVMGILVKQYTLGLDASQSDWIIGRELLGPQVKGKGLRSMSHPGTAYDDPILGRDPQPAHMLDYVFTTEDRGGVHINSGIPNRAFYLVATAVGGKAWVVAGRIWYEVLTRRLGANAKFQDQARETYAVAGELFGPREQRIVREAWEAVGISTAAPAQPRAVVWSHRASQHAPRRQPPVARVKSRMTKWRKRPVPAAHH